MITNLHRVVRDDLPAGYRIVLIVSVAVGAWLIVSTAWAFLAQGVPPYLADKDFANYWEAGKLVLSGQSGELFGPQSVYFAHLQSEFGIDYPWHNWSYPPHYLLLVWPLGLLGYKAALLLFLIVSAVFFIWALAALAGRSSPVVWVAASPLIVHNFEFAQNGFLTAGLGVGSLALREKRPVLAGILLGLLTVKPQLGLLFPFLLLAERRWTVIASAAATTLLLVAASATIFGVGAWVGYIDEVLPYQTYVMRELEGTFLAMLSSVYGMLRVWTIGPDVALSLHAAVALPVAVVAIIALFKVGSNRDRSIILLVATFLVTPYALSYDLGMFAAAVALIASAGDRGWRQEGLRVALLTTAMLLPIIMIPLGQMKIAVAPLVITATFILALGEAGFTAGYWRRRLTREKPEAKFTPAS